MKAESSAMRNQQPDAKRKKAEQVQVVLDKTKQNTEKLIELDFVSSDEELWVSYLSLTPWMLKFHFGEVSSESDSICFFFVFL